MSRLYADRGFLNFQGVELQDVMDINVTRNDGTKPVPTFSRDRRHKGFVKGNREIRWSFSVAVQESLSTPKIEDLDFQSNDYSCTFEQGGDRYTLVGIEHADNAQGAPAVGTEGKKNFNMLALDIIDQNGNSALFKLL